MIRSTSLALLLLAAAPLAAQRSASTFKLQKRSSTISYGAVPVGKHSLSELHVGDTWRLGMNNASTWRTEMPVLIGKQLLAPGEYRIHLKRLADERCGLEIHGSALALGDGEELRLDGALKAIKKKAKKLSIAWRKGAINKSSNHKGAKVVDSQVATVAIQFGEHEWTGDVLLIGGESRKLGKYRLTVFAVPYEQLIVRHKQPVPIAVITKGKSVAFQVVLNGFEVVVRPWLQVPSARNGFAEFEAPVAALTTSGRLQVGLHRFGGHPQVTTGGALRLLSAKIKKQDVTLALRAGNLPLTVTLVVPPDKVKK